MKGKKKINKSNVTYKENKNWSGKKKITKTRQRKLKKNALKDKINCIIIYQYFEKKKLIFFFYIFSHACSKKYKPSKQCRLKNICGEEYASCK